MQKFQEFAEEQHFQLQSQIGSMEREIADIKEAYKEKMRKCVAWEKVTLHFSEYYVLTMISPFCM